MTTERFLVGQSFNEQQQQFPKIDTATGRALVTKLRAAGIGAHTLTNAFVAIARTGAKAEEAFTALHKALNDRPHR